MNKTICAIKVLVCALLVIAVTSLEAATPLYQAVKNENAAAVQQLLQEAGTDVNALFWNDEPPLVEAAHNSEIVRLLLAAGAKVDAIGHGKMTALQQAASCGNVESVDALMAAGADVNAGLPNMTPLHFAAYHGHCAVVERLLQVPGIDVNAARNGGFTPLLEAVFNGHSAVVERLLQVPEIDVNAVEQNGQTALAYALRGGDTATAELLKAHGAK
ncbi:hypothetical protein FACS1894122_08160 [Alphaproteobacteria bacterium]|nr:hypothetical protein FACS1894122_08160 [Alphaproteobacteria bacterium]